MTSRLSCSISDADEEQRHLELRRVLRDLAQILALGGDAIGQHDDGGQRGAAEVVEHLVTAAQSWLES